jgi:hypothetical protein
MAVKRTLACLALFGAFVGAFAPSGRGQQRGQLSKYMRPKLDHSKGVLEGLALEDFGLIIKSAQAMKELSEAAEWKVSPDIAYLRFSREFQRLADDLVAQAKEKDIDGATLAYFQLTVNCVKCHKYVRDNRISSVFPGEEERRTR